MVYYLHTTYDVLMMANTFLCVFEKIVVHKYVEVLETM